MISSIAEVHQGFKHRVKDAEKALVMSLISTTPELTRKRLIEMLDIRPTTVSNVVQELLDQGLIAEGPPQNRGSQGRPELQLLPRFSRLVAVSVRVGSRNLVAALIDFGDHVIAEETRTVPETVTESEAPATLVHIIASVRGQAPADSSFVGVGLSFPGIVNSRSGRWVNSGRWANIRELDAADLERELGVPVHMFGMQAAELRYLLERRPELQRGGTLLFHWGYGIGAAYAFDGAVMSSTLGSFSEIGHVRMFPQSRKRCMCGDFGCLETKAALWALLPRIREAFPDAPEKETAFEHFYAGIEPLSLPGITAALDSVGLALESLYRILFPDRLLVFGPFTSHDEIAGKLARRFHRELPHYAPADVSLEMLQNATPVCLMRLNDAIDLRYAVLYDIDTRVAPGEPIDQIWRDGSGGTEVAAEDHTMTESETRAVLLHGGGSVEVPRT